MYIGKEIKEVETGTYKLVPFCDDCNSEDIVQICNKCGSKNIKHPMYTNLITSDDTRGIKMETKTVEVHIYKCDKCGKQFDTTIDKFISYSDGSFEPYKYVNDWDYNYMEGQSYEIEKDLCIDCKNKIVEQLNKKLEEIISKKYVNNIIEDFFNNK